MKNLFQLIGYLIFLLCCCDSAVAATPVGTLPRINEASSYPLPHVSYVYGHLSGPLAPYLTQHFRPIRKWQGQTDGPVLMSGAQFLKLSAARKSLARKVILNGYPVLITSVNQLQVKALHNIVGVSPGISLDRMPNRYSVLDTYGLALPNSLMRMIAVSTFPKLHRNEPSSSKNERAHSVAKWVSEYANGSKKEAVGLSSTTSGTPLNLSPTSPPWSLTTQDAMPAYWGTCGSTAAGQQCVNQITQQINSWMVYQSDAVSGQPSDYFVMQTSANVSTSGCKDFYGTRPHSTRIAGYWLRQFNTAATVPEIPISEMSIYSQYAPQQANPSVTITTGTSWGISGTGTAGYSSQGPSASLGFTAGVNYSNTRSQTYQALQTEVNINATPELANVASWTYDSWQFVHANIEPSNEACGGPGLNANGDALPGIIYGETFSPNQNWVWQALPAVRQTFNGQALPVNLDSSMLLGWAFYSGGQSCSLNNPPFYDFKEQGYSGQASVVGSGPTSGLLFDVSCNVGTVYGTIPLGPYATSDQNNSIGNPGTPYALTPWSVNVPFAPTSVIYPCPTLTGLSPTSGPVGAVVTLTGENLSTVTTLNFGGTTIPSSSFSFTPAQTIQVPAPNAKTGTVDVSVTNPSCTSNAISFTYTP